MLSISPSNTPPAPLATVAHIPGIRALTNAKSHRHHRNRVFVAVGVFVCLAVFAVWEIVSVRVADLEPVGAFAFGVILGAMTGAGIVIRRSWHSCLANRT